jgi:predicted short-subunit dehydrogenase-like oxidoreductase (DUF2520 family)
MSERKSVRPAIAIVGAGSLGSALALSLRAAGYRITDILSRDRKSSRQKAHTLAGRVGASAAKIGGAHSSAGVVWLCVPDREIAACARSLATANWKGKIALHSSGALTSDELALLRQKGARVASVHPLMTFVPGVIPSLRGAGFAMEGDREALRVARRIVTALGGESFLIDKNNKALYHTWGTFISPLFTSLLAVGERVALAAGVPREKVRRWAVPIVRQTLANYASQGGAKGFSGPIVRGDAAVVTKHLAVLRSVPTAREVYLALARSALHTLPARNRERLKKSLK